MRWFFDHYLHKVFKNVLFHLMPIEAVGMLVDVCLQVLYRVMDDPQPCLEQLWWSHAAGGSSFLSFLISPKGCWEILFQAFVAWPFVGSHTGPGPDVVFHKALQVLSAGRFDHLSVHSRYAFALFFYRHHDNFLFPFVSTFI